MAKAKKNPDIASLIRATLALLLPRLGDVLVELRDLHQRLGAAVGGIRHAGFSAIGPMFM
jgi:hypothetical protein